MQPYGPLCRPVHQQWRHLTRLLISRFPCPSLPVPQSASRLLVFNDKGAEADCTAQLQRQYACNDWRLYKSGVVLNLLLAWHMCRTCGWRSPLPVLAEAAMFAAGYWLSQQRCGLYLQHRSLILGAILAGHQVLVRGARCSGRVERAPGGRDSWSRSAPVEVFYCAMQPAAAAGIGLGAAQTTARGRVLCCSVCSFTPQHLAHHTYADRPVGDALPVRPLQPQPARLLASGAQSLTGALDRSPGPGLPSPSQGGPHGTVAATEAPQLSD